MGHNKGWAIQEKMRTWFKAKDHYDDAVDFHTKKSLYEVKSCKLFNGCYNNNHLRKFNKRPHKNIKSHQLGRFTIDIKNHVKIWLKAIQEEKIPKYVFVIIIGTQRVWKVLSWEEVNYLLGGNKDYKHLRIRDVFDLEDY